MASDTIPARLYKYRAVTNRTLAMLVEDSIHFSDPSTFNDPLDAKPNLQTDLGADELAAILRQLVEQRVRAEMTAAARSIKYRGPRTTDHIERHSRKQADQIIADIRYNAGDPEIVIDDPERFLFGRYVEEELLRRYDKGISSLAKRPNCPLMWSHYGDQHRGVCIGYAIPEDMQDQLHKVRYGGRRSIPASLVARMLDGDRRAQSDVDKAVLLLKAQAWHYEQEWRLIGSRGRQSSLIELKEIVFGMRCEAPVVYGIVKALEDRSPAVRFHEIQVEEGRFILKKRSLNLDELSASFPRNHRAIHDSLADLDLE